jgi:hypothetical protein
VGAVLLAAAVGAALLSAAAAGAGPGMMARQGGAPASATLLIRHQRAHCHAWSLNGGPFAAVQTVSLTAGGTIRVIDDDVMPHRLVQVAGPAVSMRNGTTMPMMGRYGSKTPGLMNHMGATTTVAFAQPGTYRFRTRAGEDYFKGVVTTGDDNVLALTVHVS